MLPVNEEPWILGISASHNGSACLLKGDEIVVAIQEERLTRFKRHRIRGAGPSRAVAYCLNYAGIEPSELSLVVLCVQGRAGLSSAAHRLKARSCFEFAK